MEVRRQKSVVTRGLLRLFFYILLFFRSVMYSIEKKRGARFEPKRVGLFVSMELLGGGIVISAMAKSLKCKYPDARICVVGEECRSGRLKWFFERHSWADELIICPDREKSGWLDWFRFYRMIRRQGFDMCVQSPNNSCSDSAFLFLCGVPMIIGTYLPDTWPWQAGVENRFLTERITTEVIGDGPYRLLSFPEAYARTFTGRFDFVLGDLVPYVKFERETLSCDASEGVMICMHPGGIESRRWPWQRFAMLTKRILSESNATIFLLGGKPESELIDNIVAETESDRVVPCCNCSLNQTLNYISRSCLYLGNSSGLMHAAVALGTPTLVLLLELDRMFSGTDAGGEQHKVISKDRLEDITTAEVWNEISGRFAFLPLA